MTALIIITFLSLGIYAALLLFYRQAFIRIPGYTARSAPFSTFISVIIPARNEESNIDSCIGSILEQSYPNTLFEIIVADDHSEDDTASIVKSYSDRNVKLLSVKDHISSPINSYKKKAIELAIAEAKGTLIVATDADCYLPPHWLQTIASFYEEKRPAFIAAPVSINCSNRFIEMFQSLDFMSLQGITAAVVSKKQMTMCNGANMAYERAAFNEVNGFAGIDDIASGDDMLLMHKIFKRYPERVMFLKSQDAITYTEPVHSVKEFLNQRIRWASKADKYEDKRILPVLILVYIFNLPLLLLPISMLFTSTKLVIAGSQFSIFQLWSIAFLLKIIAELLFLFPVAKFFHRSRMLWLFPIMQPFHIVYTVIAGWLGKFGSYTWKQRKVK